MIPSIDLKIITIFRNCLSVLVLILGGVWIWATKQEHWAKDFIEPWLVVVGALIAFLQFLLARWGAGQSDSSEKSYRIANTHANRERLKLAREAIGQAHRETALKLLAEINTPSVDGQVALLSARNAKLRQSNMEGTLTHGEESTDSNRLNRDILQLVAMLERQLMESDKLETEVRSYLKSRYSERIHQKLANRQPINLRRLPTNEGTSEDTSETFVQIDHEDIRGHIAETFGAAHGRLLITGKPGGGKTTLLIQLELALLETLTDELPVLLNLATWQKEFVTLETWLKELLPAELGTSKDYATELLQQKRLVLLFDGLDEVREEDRKSCLEAIGRYREMTNGRYVITSRTEEYKAVAKDAPVHLQIEVGDLTFEQMVAELEAMGHEQAEALPLLKAIQRNEQLREVAQTPFYFNSLQLLFAGGTTLSELNFDGTTAEEIRDRLTPLLVEYELSAIPTDKGYTADDAKRYLSFLATNMTKYNKVVFELLDLQYSWYPEIKSKIQFGVASFLGAFVKGLSEGLIAILVMHIIITIKNSYFGFHGFSFFFIGLLKFGFAGAILGGLFKGFLVLLSPSVATGYLVIYTKGSIRVSVDKISKYIKKNIPFAFFLFLMVFAFLLIIDNPTRAFLYSCELVIANIIVFGALETLNQESSAIIQINKPYQRFIASAKMMHFSILQHWHLMYLLSRKGCLPFKIVPFLNDMVQHKMLESDGATWRFRHRILQDYFGSQGNEGV